MLNGVMEWMYIAQTESLAGEHCSMSFLGACLVPKTLVGLFLCCNLHSQHFVSKGGLELSGICRFMKTS